MGCANSTQKIDTVVAKNIKFIENKPEKFKQNEDDLIKQNFGAAQPFQQSRIVKRGSLIKSSSHSTLPEVGSPKNQTSSFSKDDLWANQADVFVKNHQDLQVQINETSRNAENTEASQPRRSLGINEVTPSKVELFNKQKPLPTVMEETLQYFDSGLLKSNGILKSFMLKQSNMNSQIQPTSSFIMAHPSGFRSSRILKKSFGLS